MSKYAKGIQARCIAHQHQELIGRPFVILFDWSPSAPAEVTIDIGVMHFVVLRDVLIEGMEDIAGNFDAGWVRVMPEGELIVLELWHPEWKGAFRAGKAELSAFLLETTLKVHPKLERPTVVDWDVEFRAAFPENA